MSRQSSASLTLGVLLALAAVPAGAAKRLTPPSMMLTESQNIVAAATAVEVTENGILFVLEESLYGESTERFVVRMAETVRSQVEIGRRYVVGYTTLRRDPRGRSRDYQLDPAGPRLVGVPAVGPALLEDTAAIRGLVRQPPGGHQRDRRHILDAILEQLPRPDPATRRFVLAELALRPGLMELVSDSDVEVLRRVLESGELEPMSLDYLLRAAAPLADRGDTTWLADGCRRTISARGPLLDLASPVPAMLETAIATLARVGGAGDVALLEPHLASNNPAVGRAAIEAMGRLDPTAARAAAEHALSSGDLHIDVRRAVQRVLGSLADGVSR